MPNQYQINNINKNIQKLQSFLKDFLLSEAKKYKSINWSSNIENKILPFVVSGKSMRGLIVLLSSPKIDKDILRIASAIELLHSAFLIHDDIMDRDEKRRGQDSIYIQYKKQINSQNSLHYGISQAITLGDICIFLAFNLLNQIKNPNKEKIISFCVDEIVKVGFGQMEDVFVGEGNKNPNLDTIIEIYRLKTARYSISLPAVLGYLSNTDYKSQSLNNIIKAGEYIGIAFQMKDDYLGIWGDSLKNGKGVFKDVSYNKKTVIKYLLLENSSKQEKLFIDEIFGKKDLAKLEIKKLFELLDKYKIKEKHDQLILDYNLKFKSLSKKLPENLNQVLEFLQDFNNQRNK